MAYITLEGVAGLFVFIFCAAFVFWDIERSKKFEAIHLTILAMGIVYGLFFPLSIHGANNGYFDEGHFILNARDDFLIYPFVSVLAVISVYFGWRTASSKKLGERFSIFRGVSQKRLIFWLYVMLLLGILTQYLYVIDYGGFIAYLELSVILRSGLIDVADKSRFSFLLPFGGFAVVAFYGFFGLFLTERRSLSLVLGLLVSFVCAAYVVFASAGRVVIISSLAIIILAIFLANKINRRSIFIAAILGAPVVLLVFFIISNALNLKGADDFGIYLARETSYIFISFFAQLEKGNNFQLFQELFLAPAYLLPQSMTNTWLDSATDINTRLIYGANKGEFGITGSVPVDLLTFGIMQFHVFGVLIYAFTFGYILRLLSWVASSFSQGGVAASYLAYIFIRIAAFGVFYSYPKHILHGSFAFITCLLVIWSVKFFRGSFGRRRQY